VTERTAYFVASEALANVAKHSAMSITRSLIASGRTGVGDEIALEAPEHLGAPARRRELQAWPVEIDEQADVVVAPPAARLVEPTRRMAPKSAAAGAWPT